MALLLQPTEVAGGGLSFINQIVTGTNRNATVGVVLGDIQQFDLANAAAETDNNTYGSADTSGQNSGFNSLINPVNTDREEQGHLFGVALSTVGIDTECEFLVSGRCDAFVHNESSLDVSIGNKLVLDTSVEDKALTNTPSTSTEGGVRIMGIALETVSAPATPALGDILFDGINGLGTMVT